MTTTTASTAELDKFDLDQIRQFWTTQANEHGPSHQASWSDRPVIDLEIERIARYLDDGDQVLDIGCANGFSTLHLAERKAAVIHGIDYIPEMIDQAQSRLAGLDESTRRRVKFSVGDIMSLDLPTAAFDKVITIRVVINLGCWENQLRGIHEAARTLRSGGLLLMSEATVQGLERLNAFRGEWNLPPIPEPPFNVYLDEDKVRDAVADRLELLEIVNFASSYFVGTRVLKPLLAKLHDLEHKVPDPNMHWNRWFASLPAAGDYGTQKLFVFRKK